MALITPAALTALNTTLSLAYQGAYSSAPVWWPKVATEVPSATAGNTYGWMQAVDQLRQWIGPKVVRDLAASSYALPNLPFELTFGVDRHDIEDQQTGVYGPRAAMMGQAAAKWPDQQLVVIIAANGLCFDGLSFFNANHTIDPGGVQSNTNTLGLTPANYATAREAMMAFRGETGQPLGVTPNLLVVPPQLEQQGLEILKASLIANAAGTAGISNVNAGSAELLVIPELATVSATTWFLFDGTKPIKSLVWQVRQAPQFTDLTNLADAQVFFQRMYYYGVEARGAAGYGPWWLAYRGNV